MATLRPVTSLIVTNFPRRLLPNVINNNFSTNAQLSKMFDSTSSDSPNTRRNKKAIKRLIKGHAKKQAKAKSLHQQALLDLDQQVPSPIRGTAYEIGFSPRNERTHVQKSTSDKRRISEKNEQKLMLKHYEEPPTTNLKNETQEGRLLEHKLRVVDESFSMNIPREPTIHEQVTELKKKFTQLEPPPALPELWVEFKKEQNTERLTSPKYTQTVKKKKEKVDLKQISVEDYEKLKNLEKILIHLLKIRMKTEAQNYLYFLRTGLDLELSENIPEEKYFSDSTYAVKLLPDSELNKLSPLERAKFTLSRQNAKDLPSGLLECFTDCDFDGNHRISPVNHALELKNTKKTMDNFWRVSRY